MKLHAVAVTAMLALYWHAVIVGRLACEGNTEHYRLCRHLVFIEIER